MIDSVPVIRIGKRFVEHPGEGFTLYVHIHFQAVQPGAVVIKMISGLCFQVIDKSACLQIFERSFYNRPFALLGMKLRAQRYEKTKKYDK